MEGEVKISLGDFLTLSQQKQQAEDKYVEVSAHAELFRREASALLNAIYQTRDISGFIKEYNKVSEGGFIEVDTEASTIELQIKTS